MIFGSVIQNIADGRPKVRYLVVVDDSKNMLEEIVKVSGYGHHWWELVNISIGCQ
jgi:hypothetical protein